MVTTSCCVLGQGLVGPQQNVNSAVLSTEQIYDEGPPNEDTKEHLIFLALGAQKC